MIFINWKIIELDDLNEEIEFGQEKGIFRLTSVIKGLKLYEGDYKLNVYFSDNFSKIRIDTVTEQCNFKIINTNKRTYYWHRGSAQYKEENTFWNVMKLP